MLTLILSLQSIKLGIFPLLAIFGSLHAILDYRKNIKSLTGKSLEQEVSFGQGLFSLLFSSLGGSIMTGLLLGQPPGWFNNDGVILVFILIFTLQYLSGGIFIVTLCERTAPLRWIIEVMDAISHGFSITSLGVDLALSSAHWKNSPSAAILCGMVSGLGSQLLQETFHLYDKNWECTAPPMLSKQYRWFVSSSIHISTWASALYYFGLYFGHIRPDKLKATIVIAVTLCHINNRLFVSFRSPRVLENDHQHSLLKISEKFKDHEGFFPLQDIKRE